MIKCAGVVWVFFICSSGITSAWAFQAAKLQYFGKKLMLNYFCEIEKIYNAFIALCFELGFMISHF